MLYFIVREWVIPTLLVIHGSLFGESVFYAMKIDVESIRDKIEIVVEGLGFELAELSAPTIGGRLILRVSIHSPKGVTLDNCAEVSHALSDMLDTEDLISSRYTLEVSSLGLETPLITAKDFKRRVGERVKVSYNFENGRKTVEGELVDSDEVDIKINADGETITIPVGANPRGKIII